ncbi:MAG: hypothetical protein RL726_690 [Actinomycetota bacterium]|jgi:hypothetical protein
MRKQLTVVLIAALASVGLMACGGDDATDTSSAPIDSAAPEDSSPTSGSVETGEPSADTAAETVATTEAPEDSVAPAQPMETTTTMAATPVASGPTFGAVSVDCLNRGLRVNVEVNEGSSTVSRVVVKRANEENAELETRLTFLGPDTGSGNVWNGVNVAGYVDRITIVATDADGRTASTTSSFNLPC